MQTQQISEQSIKKLLFKIITIKNNLLFIVITVFRKGILFTINDNNAFVLAIPASVYKKQGLLYRIGRLTNGTEIGTLHATLTINQYLPPATGEPKNDH